MTKEGFIDSILAKLHNNIQLNDIEINTIERALRESEHCFQEPYYEVIYHDEYGNKESRIMNPILTSTKKEAPGYIIESDYFELNFKRIIPEEK